MYRDVGYDGILMLDSEPRAPADPRGWQAFAFTFGYIKALIAAVSAEP